MDLTPHAVEAKENSYTRLKEAIESKFENEFINNSLINIGQFT